MKKCKAIPVHNAGFIQLVDCMGDDLTPARIARKSFANKREYDAEAEKRLTNYLVTHKHTTPLEFCEMVWLIKMPIFVARQWVRHRTASIEEISLRYVKASKEFYIPKDDRCLKQSETSKQGSSDESVDDPLTCIELIKKSGELSFAAYEELINQGMAKELARTVLPLGTYTEWYWKCDLHNTLHFLALRLDPHAQYEIRIYALHMLLQLSKIFPTVCKAWYSTLNEDTKLCIAGII